MLPRRLGRDKKAVSNVIVIVLSLTLIVVIVSNVVLWSYEMNQYDWERMREDLAITDVYSLKTYSEWFPTQIEYQVNLGSLQNGNYTDTQAVDGKWETFQEEGSLPSYRLDINGTFLVDLSSYPYSSIITIEVQIRYRANANIPSEKFYLKAYNWSSGTYTDNGFNNTLGHSPTNDWNYYAVNFTDKWSDYMREDGKLFVKLQDEGSYGDTSRTTIDIDFLAVRVVVGAVALSFKNRGALTARIVSLWIIDANAHNRYNADLYIGAGENATYVLGGAELPSGQYIVKAVTERGNIAVYSSS